MQMEREEGELTDEDLEDVSDISALSEIPMQVVLSGKSPSLSANREPFRELSLTSVSDDDSEIKEPKYRIITTKPHYEVYHKHRHYRENRKYSGIKRVRKLSEQRIVRRRPNNFRKDYSSLSSSSDESEYYTQDKRILRQLRDAVRINRSHNLPNCSLRTRLKRMIEPDSHGSKNSNSEEDNDLETLRDLALQSKSKKENDATNATDKDLIELRLKALQSAVLKKHQIRRKNKEEQQKKVQSEIKEDSSIKENDEKEIKTEQTENVENNIDVAILTQETIINSTDKNSNITSDKTNKDTEKNDTNLSENFISDEINKNITDSKNVQSETENLEKESKSNLDEDEAILRAMLLSSIYNNNDDPVHANQENIQAVVPKNSNTEVPITKTEITKNNIDEDEDILRAMLLANISKKISNKKIVKQTNNLINKNHTNLITVKKPIKRPIDTKNAIITPSVPVNRIIINLNSDSDSDCDQIVTERKISGNYTKNKDLFDKSLSLFLQQAREKSDADSKSDISHLPRSQQLEYRRLKRKLLQLTKNKSNLAAKKKSLINLDENTKVNMNTKCDKKIISATNMNQIPKTSLKTISNDKQINNKDDRLQVKGKYEELGPLMSRVSDARIARDKAQTEVKRLINDLRIARAELTATHQTYTALVQQLVAEKSLIDKRLDDNQKLENEKNVKTSAICTSTPNKLILKEIPREISCDLSSINESVQCQIDIDQPAELDKTIINAFEEKMDVEENPVQEEKTESSFLKYSSPLEHIKLNREQPESNPLSILCPYDLLGVCRDPDCSFRHCDNAITE